jgi:hypothetical protein
MLDRALYFMTEAMNKDLPFFLYFSPTPPHGPGVEDALLGRFTKYQTPAGVLATAPDVNKYCSSCKLASRKEIWDSVVGISSTSTVGNCRNSLAALRWIDESLGVLYDFLSERGVIGNTYIVISTDHGSAKLTLYELGTRVPLYVAGPGIQTGIVVDEMVSHVDLAPTFLRWAGCCADGSSAMPIHVDGLSWSSLATGEERFLDRTGIRTESYFDRGVLDRGSLKRLSIRTRAIVLARIQKLELLGSDAHALKLINEVWGSALNLAIKVGDAYPALYNETQLYNLTADPLEQRNLWSPLMGQLRPQGIPHRA